MASSMAGKRVLVTGGSRGIGLATCLAFAREGATVVTCARGQESLNEALAQIGNGSTGAALDVRDEQAFADWVRQSAERMGGLDVIISNVSTRVDPKSPGWWAETFEADLMQHVRLKTLALPMLGEGGSMLFMGSIAAVLTTLPAYEEAYGAMKAGLVNLVGQWAAALGPKGIRVNAVSPGPIDFPGGWWDGVRQANPAAHARAGAMAALGRLGRPEEVAEAVLWLSSPAASFVTGVNLRVDGGLIKTANF
jgi:NAD(P)-dependent dehydrogenase (short-subunit alcohol dehydrogenase family)